MEIQETFLYQKQIVEYMSSSDSSGGPMSEAGLVRYFDSEDSNAILFDPRTVLATAIATGFLVMFLQIFI
jgi:preprotein translocase subunit Sec61beta